jgi:hypothetical protein
VFFTDLVFNGGHDGFIIPGGSIHYATLRLTTASTDSVLMLSPRSYFKMALLATVPQPSKQPSEVETLSWLIA